MQEWRVDGLTGYLALCAAIKRAIDVNTFIQFYVTLLNTNISQYTSEYH